MIETIPKLQSAGLSVYQKLSTTKLFPVITFWRSVTLICVKERYSALFRSVSALRSVMALSHLAGSTLRTKNLCYSSIRQCSFHVLLLSAKYLHVRRFSFQIHSCEVFISCRTGDSTTTGTNICAVQCRRRCTSCTWGRSANYSALLRSVSALRSYSAWRSVVYFARVLGQHCQVTCWSSVLVVQVPCAPWLCRNLWKDSASRISSLSVI